jgi:hypothetical protein
MRNAFCPGLTQTSTGKQLNALRNETALRNPFSHGEAMSPEPIAARQTFRRVAGSEHDANGPAGCQALVPLTKHSPPSPTTFGFLVPRLCLGTHCPRGSASDDRQASSPNSTRQAEPARQCVPRQSLGTRLSSTRTRPLSIFYLLHQSPRHEVVESGPFEF